MVFMRSIRKMISKGVLSVLIGFASYIFKIEKTEKERVDRIEERLAAAMERIAALEKMPRRSTWRS